MIWTSLLEIQFSDLETLRLLVEPHIFQTQPERDAIVHAFTVLEFPKQLSCSALLALNPNKVNAEIISQLDPCELLPQLSDLIKRYYSSNPVVLKQIQENVHLLGDKEIPSTVFRGTFLRPRGLTNVSRSNVGPPPHTETMYPLLDVVIGDSSGPESPSCRLGIQLVAQLFCLGEPASISTVPTKVPWRSLASLFDCSDEGAGLWLRQNEKALLLLQYISKHASYSCKDVLSSWTTSLAHALLPEAALFSLAEDKTYNLQMFQLKKSRLFLVYPFLKSALVLLESMQAAVPLSTSLYLSLFVSWCSNVPSCAIWTESSVSEVAERAILSLLASTPTSSLLQILGSTLSADETTHFGIMWYLHTLLVPKSSDPPVASAIAQATVQLLTDHRTATKSLGVDLASKAASIDTYVETSAKIQLISHLLKSLHVRTPEFVHSALLVAVRVLSTLPDAQIKSPHLQETVFEAIIYELNYVENLRVLCDYASLMKRLIEIFGVDVLYYSKRILPKLLWMLDSKLEPLVLATCDCISCLISHCWFGLLDDAVTIFGTALFVYIEHIDDDELLSASQAEDDHRRSNAAVRDASVQLLLLVKQSSTLENWNEMEKDIHNVPALSELLEALKNSTRDGPVPEKSFLVPMSLPSIEEAKRFHVKQKASDQPTLGSNLRSLGKSSLRIQNLLINSSIPGYSIPSSQTGMMAIPGKGPLIQVLK